ncbi:MAG TPA: hypothetical protein VGV92_01005 [Gammaproteobacteria bacterium]|nr:hypothetical protein [Gammaproteobacteria bacterium]
MQDQAALLKQTIDALVEPLEAYREAHIFLEATRESFNELLRKLQSATTLSPAQACVQFVAWLKENNLVLTSAEYKLEKEMLANLKKCNPDEYFKARVGLLLEEYKKKSAFNADIMEVIQRLLLSGLSAEITRQKIQRSLNSDWVMHHGEGVPLGDKENELIMEMGSIHSEAFPAPVKKSSSSPVVSLEVLPSPNTSKKVEVSGRASPVYSAGQQTSVEFGRASESVQFKDYKTLRQELISAPRIDLRRQPVEDPADAKKREQEQLDKLSKQHQAISAARKAFINRTEAALQLLLRGLSAVGVAEKKTDLSGLRKISETYYSPSVDEKKKKAIVDDVAETFLDKLAAFVPNFLLRKKYLDELDARKKVVEKSFAVIAQVAALQQAVIWNSKDATQVNWKVFETSELKSINPDVGHLTNKAEFDAHVAIITKSETALRKVGEELEWLKSQRTKVDPPVSVNISAGVESDYLLDHVETYDSTAARANKF